jgi:hypothetical protein
MESDSNSDLIVCFHIVGPTAPLSLQITVVMFMEERKTDSINCQIARTIQ